MRKPVISLYEKATAAELGWSERLRTAKQAGFDGLEISLDETEMRLNRLTWPTRVVHDLRVCAFDEDVRLTGLRLSALRRYALGSGEPAMTRRAADILSRAVDWAVEAGVPVLQIPLVDAYGEPSTERTLARLSERLLEGAALAAGAGVLLALSPMPEQAVDTLEKAEVLITSVASPFVGLYPDARRLADALATLAGVAEVGAAAVSVIGPGTGPTGVMGPGAPSGGVIGPGVGPSGVIGPGAGSPLGAAALSSFATVPGAGRLIAVSAADASPALRTARAMGVARFTAMIWHQDRPDWSTVLLASAQALAEAVGA